MCTIFSFEWISSKWGSAIELGVYFATSEQLTELKRGMTYSIQWSIDSAFISNGLIVNCCKLFFYCRALTGMWLIIHPLAVYKCFRPFLKSYPLLKTHRTVDILGKRKINRGFHLSLWALLIFKCSFEHIFPRFFRLVQFLPFSLVNFFNPLVKILPFSIFSAEALFYAFTNLEDYFRILS